MKKILLGLGSIAAVVAPVSAVVACGWNEMEVNDLSAKSTLDEATFKTAVETQGDLINVRNKEVNLLNDKVATEVEKAASLKAKQSKMDDAAKKTASATAKTNKEARLIATKKELKALIEETSKNTANKKSLNDAVDKATDVTALRNAIKASIPTTTAIIATLKITAIATDTATTSVIIKGLPMLSLSFDDKIKVLTITARYIDGLKTIALSHNVKMTFV